MENNPYDWAEPQAPQEDDVTETEKRMHRLFKQNEEGALLLDNWLRATVFNLRGNAGDLSEYRSGFLDGQAHIAKVIKHSIERVEKYG